MRAVTTTAGKRPVVLLSYGLGKHSTAAAVELIENPSRRDFDLDQLILLTAMTGNEWGTTKALVEEHLLPLLRHHRVRYVQVARKGPLEQDGISVLSRPASPAPRFNLRGRHADGASGACRC